MGMQSSPHSWTMEIIKALCNTSKICAFFAWVPRLPDNGILPVFVTLIVEFFGNYTVGPLWVSFMYASTLIYLVSQ